MPTIHLPYKFKLRDYQKEPWNAMMHPEFNRGILVVPRRNGKDILSWNTLICKAMQRPALYYYVAPYYNQVRQIIWEGFDKDGRRFLDYIPNEIVKNKTKLDMRIDLANGSQIKLQGSDAIDRIVGTNPFGIVFTEFSLHKPAAWEYLRPILAENGGWAVFNGTPRGLNHFFDLYQQANSGTNWYVQYLTRDDTGIPTLEAIEEDRRSGMPQELINQEYYCSFLSGVVGSFYSEYIEALRNNGNITTLPWDPSNMTYTVWDIGMGDYTAIWFAQFEGKRINLIDYYENSGKDIAHYAKVLKDKPYVYAEHIAPWDANKRDAGTGLTLTSQAADVGIIFNIQQRKSFELGIELVREILPFCWFDAVRCDRGIQALTHYKKKPLPQSKEETVEKQDFSHLPAKGWANHGADAFRYLAIARKVYGLGLEHMDHRPNVNRSMMRNITHLNEWRQKDGMFRPPKTIRSIKDGPLQHRRPMVVH